MAENGGNKRVILITGDSSKWYEQAIFIVRKNLSNSQIPRDFVEEAESIIENYMREGNSFLKETFGKKTNVEYAVSGVNIDALPKIKAAAVASPSPKRRKKGFDFALNLIMLFGCVVLACLVGSMIF